MATAKDAGKSFLERVLARVDPSKRDAVTALLDDENALTEIGAGALRLEDYSRNMAAVKATETQQRSWWNQHEGALREYEAIKGTGGRPNDLPAADRLDIAAQLKAQDERYQQALGQLETQGVSLTASLSHLGLKHLKEFDEVLDTETLVRQAIEANRPLTSFYDEQVATRRKERAEANLAAQIAAAKEEGRTLGVQETLNRQAQPYPVGHDGAPSTLAGLTFHGKDVPAPADTYSLDAALATLREETARTR